MKQKRPGKCTYMLLMILLFSCIGTVSAEELHVGEGKAYPNISTAYENAEHGDIIIVSDGIYIENLTINKIITIRSENGSVSTIVEARSPDVHVFNITADNVVIRGFRITGPANYSSIHMNSVSDCNISDNAISASHTGIYCNDVSNSTFTNNTITLSTHGILMRNSPDNTLINNSMTLNDYNFGCYGNDPEHFSQHISTSNLVDGKPLYYLNDLADFAIPSDAGQVYVVNSSNITVKDITISKGHEGIVFAYTDSSKIENVTFSQNRYGVVLFRSDSNILDNINADDNFYGIFLNNSINNDVINSMISSNGWDGISLYSSSELNTINNNTILSNDCDGIYLDRSPNNTLSNNTISNNTEKGVNLYRCAGNSIAYNLIHNNKYGIYLDHSTNNTLIGNTMESNNYNFHVHGAIPGYFDHIIYPDNLVNGKPLYYLNEQSDIEIPSDAGQVYVINSTNITVKDIEMSDTSYGVVFVATEESTIENVTLSESLCGIYLLNSGPNVLDKIRSNNNLVGMMIEGSSNITMSCSSINSNHFGVMLRELDNSTLANVNASGNSFVGIALFSCTDNYLRQNMANSNIYGLQLLDSNNNHLMENTVSNNSNVGIYLSTSPDNTLSGNVASYNRIAGLRISSSDNNTLTGNTFTNNTLSLQEAASVSLNAEISALQQTIEQISINDVDNAISPDSENIVSSISLNDVQPGFHGVYILNSDNILLSNTHATGNDYALYASGSLNTTVSNLVLTEELSQMSFVSNENRLILRENCLDPISLPGKINVNGYVDLFRSPGEQFNIHLMPADTGIDIRFFYNDSGMSSAGESTISLYRLNGSQWVKVPDATLNTNDNYVCATITVAEANPAINAVMETYEATLALFKDVESSISGSQAPDSGSSVMARERREGTISDLPMGEEGGVNGDFVVTSSSGTTTITLYEGTKALDPSGNPVSRIIITTPSSLPAGTPQEVIRSGLYIRFGPSGTTFSQDIMVTMDFNPQDFKDRAPVIYTYTSEDGWIALETTVDWENGRATAMISHFSLYALFGTDVQEKQEVVVQTRIADEKPSSGLTEGTPVENKADKGYVYWTIGTVIILVLGITVVSRQKNKRGL